MRLPTYQEAEKCVRDPDQEETLLDVFIYECSPEDYTAHSTFRWHLQRLLEGYSTLGVARTATRKTIGGS